eukprot:CAMPEP_0168431986 /NCGR_PEP_ID=MMETSP0228-20121227/38664_1 /TAXON_ID=133427 /ORGANISM="Protoceratium reticulatum, Strain CCCM 535 (=CCMP 1889)" /LENGTH=60 /DNA_ID=CAMNT_0008446111 /DNA_START=21 /DNA_END=200 /DNA_ORIENTATION=-
MALLACDARCVVLRGGVLRICNHMLALRQQGQREVPCKLCLRLRCEVVHEPHHGLVAVAI